ncbi:MAG: hypothetical protein RPR97_07275, partial [Colwellia sp.]
MTLPINVVSIKEGLEGLQKLYNTAKDIFKESGNPKRQIYFQVTNKSEKTLELAGSSIGAGVIATQGVAVWKAPFKLEPQQATLIPIESSGFSAQGCFSYGLRLKDDIEVASSHFMFLLYAYNPRVGYNYGGWHNIAGDDEVLTGEQWRQAIDDRGQYAGNNACSEATSGAGPDWQDDVTHSPTAQYHFNDNLVLKRSASREAVKGELDVSILKIDFTIEDNTSDTLKTRELMKSYSGELEVIYSKQ